MKVHYNYKITLVLILFFFQSDNLFSQHTLELNFLMNKDIIERIQYDTSNEKCITNLNLKKKHVRQLSKIYIRSTFGCFSYFFGRPYDIIKNKNNWEVRTTRFIRKYRGQIIFIINSDTGEVISLIRTQL